jgi:hypothetical protein
MIRGRRGSPCSASAFLRAAYLAGIALGISALYSCGDSALFLRDEWGRATREADKGVEAIVWTAAAVAAAAYLIVQGSSPGYVKRARRTGADGAGSLGSEVVALAAAMPAGEAKRGGAPVAAAVTAAAASAAAAETAMALEAADIVIEAPSDSVHRPAALTTQRALLAPSEVGTANGGLAAGLGGAAAGLESLLAEPADFALPEVSADSVAAAAAAAAASEAARAGVRECKWCHVLQPRRAHHCRACNAW